MDVAYRPLSEREDCELKAYNAAFAELGFSWEWSEREYLELAEFHDGVERLQHYVATVHPHLLKAYDAESLARLIESLKADCHAQPEMHRPVRLGIDGEF